MKVNALLCANKNKAQVYIVKITKVMKSLMLRQIMWQAWQFVKRNGFTLSEALKQAWALWRLKKAMTQRIVKFYYQKVDGSIREAWGTLRSDLMPKMDERTDRKTENITVQVYFDTEKQEFRCFKRANLVIVTI